MTYCIHRTVYDYHGNLKNIDYLHVNLLIESAKIEMANIYQLYKYKNNFYITHGEENKLVFYSLDGKIVIEIGCDFITSAMKRRKYGYL